MSVARTSIGCGARTSLLDMTEGYAGHHEAPPRGGPVNRWVLRGRSTG